MSAQFYSFQWITRAILKANADPEDLPSQKSWSSLKFLHYVLIFLSIFYSAATPVTHIFIASINPHRCALVGCNDTREFEPWGLKSAIPYRLDGLPESCKVYTRKNLASEYCEFEKSREGPYDSCNEWIFRDDDNMIIKSFNLVCDENMWKLNLVGQLNILATFFSFFLLGIMSDRFGRKKVLVSSLYFSTTLAMIKSSYPSYEIFLVCEFFEALFSGGAYVVAYVLVLEMVSLRWRALFCLLAAPLIRILGGIYVVVLSYFLKDWRHMVWAINIPAFLSVLYIWFLPESVCWLITRGRLGDAKEIILKSMNKSIREDRKVVAKLEFWQNGNLSSGDDDYTNDTSLLYNMQSLISSKIIFRRFLVFLTAWFGVFLVYNGLVWSTIKPPTLEDKNAVNFWMWLAEIPGAFVAWIAVTFVKRKRGAFLAVLCFLNGLACIGNTFVPFSNNEEYPAWKKLPLQVVSITCMASAAGILNLMTAEVFPTANRSTYLGLCSMASQLAYVAASYAPRMKYLSYNYLPDCFFGGVSILLAGLAFLLPQSTGAFLPMSLKDAANLMKLETGELDVGKMGSKIKNRLFTAKGKIEIAKKNNT